VSPCTLPVAHLEFCSYPAPASPLPYMLSGGVPAGPLHPQAYGVPVRPAGEEMDEIGRGLWSGMTEVTRRYIQAMVMMSLCSVGTHISPVSHWIAKELSGSKRSPYFPK
jgi:hypothetical protein